MAHSNISVLVNRTKAWQALLKHRKAFNPDLAKMFSKDPERARKLAVSTDHLYYDFSRQLLDTRSLKLLLKLAEETKLSEKTDAMFAGEKINRTENRAVLHTALRDQSVRPIMVDGHNVKEGVKIVLDKIQTFSEEIHSGKRLGSSGKKIRNIVAVGIGGSYLGPEYLAEACRPYAKAGMTLRFIANVDGTDFAQKTADLDPAETLFVIVSKTFTTAETMKNAETAKKWMQAKMGTAPQVIEKHFIAVSTAGEKVKAFGIDPSNMFGFWDWVGGRFSATSAVGGVPLSLYLGFDKFEEILRGAYWMDQHFKNAEFEENIPVISALIDIWNINFLGYNTRALLPYSQALSRLAAHTQQVEMESNGKSVDIEGRAVKFSTGEVVFGEPGTNGQHSFYQLIHQGTQVIPCDFIGLIKPQYPVGGSSAEEVSHHEELMTNFFAQPDALAFGKTDPLSQKNFPGNRPSSSLLLQELTPFTAGMLLAWTEHRAAVKGFIWGINSFDQFGVELGKKLGLEQRQRMLEFYSTGKINTKGLNSSTAILVEAFLKGKLPG